MGNVHRQEVRPARSALVAVVAALVTATAAMGVAPVRPAVAASIPPGLIVVSSGDGFSCGLTAARGVKCWGKGANGELGNGGTADSAAPVDVTGLTSGVTQVVSGGSHSCALVTGGVVKCWGKGTSGELGNSSLFSSSSPVSVTGVSGALSIGAGRDHSCAVASSRGVQCWGYNQFGQLGNGVSGNLASVPQTVLLFGNPLGAISTVVGGGDHTCALSTGGSVYCWGRDSNGQIGNDTVQTAVTRAQPIGGFPSSVVSIALGANHSCAVVSSGSAWCWGANNLGQLGLGSNGQGSFPYNPYAEKHVPTTGHSGTIFLPIAFNGEAIWAGGDTTCGLGLGFVYCWGSNTSGALGIGSTAASTVDFSTVQGQTRYSLSSVALGPDNHVCALHRDGSTRCWGANGSGQLGNGTTTASNVPVTGTAPAGTFQMATISMSYSTSPTPQFWNKVPITVSYTCYSGFTPVDCPSAVALTEGIHDITATATDGYPSSATVTVPTIRVDQTPPVVTGQATTPPNAAGWYKSSFTIDWTCTDALSGLFVNTPCTDTTVNSSGAAVNATKTIQDNATNSTTGIAGPFKIDQTKPVTTATAPQWSNSSVTLSLDATDNLSGVASTTYSIDDGATQAGTAPVVSGEGTHTVKYSSVDVAGNVEALKTLTVRIDGTPPTISGSAAPAPNTAGWNNSDVTVSWLCGDSGGSGVASCSAPSTVTTEGAAQDVTGQAVDAAGNTATGHVPVSIDKTAPTISAVAPPTPGSGWYTGPVPVTFECTDPGGASASGISACSDGSTITGDGAHRTLSGLAVDAAGNSASATADVRIDSTPPTITGATTTAATSTGFHAGSATVHWTCADATSGVVDCPADETVTALGSTTLTHQVTDAAGNTSAPAEVTVTIDDGASTSIAGSISPAPSASGWARTPVTVHFACSAASGVASCTPDQQVSAEGGGHSIDGTVVDQLGNTASTTVVVGIDLTAPVTSVTGVADGATYVAGSVPSPACAATDALSGIASPPTLDVSGGGTGLGTFVARCEAATDRAGNSSSAMATYTVVADTGGVAGRVSTTSGAPVAEGFARLYPSRSLAAPALYSAVTGPGGEYGFGSVPSGTYYLYAGKSGAAYPGWSPSAVIVTASHTTVADAALVPGAAGAGTVSDQAGPVPGATVRVMLNGSPTGKRVVTDSAGHYVLTGLTAGTYTLQVTAYGYATQASTPFTVTTSTTTVPSPDVVLGAAPVSSGLAGTVTSSAGGRLGGVSVRLYLVGSAATNPVRSTSTAPDGTWAISGVPSGAYNVQYALPGSPSGYFPTSITLAPGAGPATLPTVYAVATGTQSGAFAPGG